jgi:hypothetical protein
MEEAFAAQTSADTELLTDMLFIRMLNLKGVVLQLG